MGKHKLHWRVQSDLEGFDEIVLTTKKPGGCLLHAEMMDRDTIFVSIGPLRVWAFVNSNGAVEVSHTEDDSVPNESEGEG